MHYSPLPCVLKISTFGLMEALGVPGPREGVERTTDTQLASARKGHIIVEDASEFSERTIVHIRRYRCHAALYEREGRVIL